MSLVIPIIAPDGSSGTIILSDLTEVDVMNRRTFVAGTTSVVVSGGWTHGNPGVSLPAGVTLQAIDGETLLSSTTMSNNYYSRNGFSVAANGAFTAGKGNWWDGLNWDSKGFFALGVFFGVYPTKLSSFLALKCPISFGYTGDTVPATDLTANGIWNIDLATGGAPESPFDATSCVGFNVDEQDMMIGNGAGGISNVAAASQVGRLWYGNQTWSTLPHGDQINGQHTRFGIQNVTMLEWFQAGEFIDGNSVLRQFDLYTADVYWCGGSADTGGTMSNAKKILANPMDGSLTGDATADQMRRGSNYGNMIDCWRSYANGTNNSIGSGAAGTSYATARFPQGTIIESRNGSTGGGNIITPAELNWGVWSSIIHGARFIDYFDDAGTGPDQIPALNAAQIATTNLQVASLATVINSPFAKGYLTGKPTDTGGGGGYLFPTYEPNWLNGGIEACVHWDGSNFYIFATTRYGASGFSPVTATFTINAAATASLATVVGESRTINISGHQFTDTFSNISDVHIYKIS